MRFIKPMFIFLLITLLMVTGCTSPKPTQDNGRVFTDTLGREVSIDTVPQKVISLSPAITEIIFALELGERIIGTTDFCNYPEEALNTPKVGGFSSPNIELIIDSEPDLVLVAAGIQIELIERLEDLGITVMSLDAEIIDDVIANIKLIGEIMDTSAKANELAQDMAARVEVVKDKVSGLDKPLVFFEVWDEPLMSAGTGTFIDNLIQLAGGENLVQETQNRYPQVNFEVLIDKDPDIYLAVDHQSQRDIMARPSYQDLKAVKTERVYTIEDDWVTLPGPRIILGLEEMARLIHPEVFE